MFCCCFLFLTRLQRNYFDIYKRADLLQIGRVPRTVAVDDQSEVSFRSFNRNQFNVGLVLRTEFLCFGDIRQMAVACERISACGSLGAGWEFITTT